VPVKRHEVMRAHGVEGDLLLHDHGRVVLFVWERRELRARADVEAREDLEIHLGDPDVRVDEIRILVGT
jgi:hypothetical protein